MSTNLGPNLGRRQLLQTSLLATALAAPPLIAARGETPVRAPDAYVETLFDQHADVFEDVLVEQLGYHVPMLVRQRLQDLKLGPFKRMLDLGCGTGLTGSALNDLCEEMIGIDISENMVVIADEKDVYETLFVAEVEDFLDDAPMGSRLAWDDPFQGPRPLEMGHRVSRRSCPHAPKEKIRRPPARPPRHP